MITMLNQNHGHAQLIKVDKSHIRKLLLSVALIYSYLTGYFEVSITDF